MQKMSEMAASRCNRGLLHTHVLVLCLTLTVCAVIVISSQLQSKMRTNPISQKCLATSACWLQSSKTKQPNRKINTQAMNRILGDRTEQRQHTYSNHGNISAPQMRKQIWQQTSSFIGMVDQCSLHTHVQTASRTWHLMKARAAPEPSKKHFESMVTACMVIASPQKHRGDGQRTVIVKILHKIFNVVEEFTS